MDKLLFCGLLCVTLLSTVIEASTTVAVEPLYPTVRHGDKITQNCTTNCQNIKQMDFEIKEPNNSKTNGSNWISVTYVIQSWDPTPNCYVNCEVARNKVEQESIKSYVSVFDFPQKVIINLLPVLLVNKPYNLTCTVPSVAPVKNLAVTILKGNSTVLHKNYSDDTEKRNQSKTEIFTLIPKISDDGVIYTCSAKLDLRPNITDLLNTSSSVTLSVFAFPEKPKITVKDVLEANKESTVTCEISGVFPPLKMKVILTYAEKKLNTTVTIKDHKVIAEAMFHADTGEQRLLCEATIENETKTDTQSITGYVLPQPVISLHKVEAGSNATINCSVIGEKPSDVSLSLKREGDALHLSEHGVYTLKAEKQDNGSTYTCETKIQVQGHTFTKTANQTLTVTYAPEINKTVTSDKALEGSNATLTCQATGNPFPQITWLKNGETVGDRETLTIVNVSKNSTGAYRCEVTNHKGKDNHTVIFTTEYSPSTPTIKKKPEKIRTGDNITMQCSADSSPPATYQWLYTASNNVVISKDNTTVHISNASETNNGNYTCVAQNKHGRSKASVQINVLFPPGIPRVEAHTMVWKGNTVRFVCSAIGNPPPSYTWLHPKSDNVNMSHDNRIIQINKARPENAGNYSCEVQNELGNSTVTVQMFVHYSPSTPTIKNKPEKIRTGDTITMQCSADSSPPATYHWLYTASNNVVISEDNTTIRIRNASKTNNGNYTCVAQNKHGNSTASVQINVLFPPGIPRVEQSDMVWKGKTVSFVCSATGNPPPSYTWLHPESDNVNMSHDNRIIQINKARPENAGNYSCEVQNELGNSTVTVQMFVHYPPEMPQITVFPETVYNDISVIINCSTDSYPPATYSWSYPSSASVHISNDNRTITIMRATQQDSGTYACNVTNKHGSHSTVKHIPVHESSIPWILIIIVPVIISFLVLVIILLYYVQHQRKTGSYDVRDPKNKTVLPNGDLNHEKVPLASNSIEMSDKIPS